MAKTEGRSLWPRQKGGPCGQGRREVLVAKAEGRSLWLREKGGSCGRGRREVFVAEGEGRFLWPREKGGSYGEGEGIGSHGYSVKFHVYMVSCEIALLF